MKQMTSNDVTKAMCLAQAAHMGQTDKAGKPIFLHVSKVSYAFDDNVYKIVGYLHDVLEDSTITNHECLAQTFSYEIADALTAISRKPGEQYFDYINRCKKNVIARQVKIADLQHNMNKARWPDMPDSFYDRCVKALEILENN